jgi:dsDNA-binding SOS-regulon protein
MKQWKSLTQEVMKIKQKHYGGHFMNKKEALDMIDFLNEIRTALVLDFDYEQDEVISIVTAINKKLSELRSVVLKNRTTESVKNNGNY